MSESDEITEWLSRNGRTALTLETAKQLAADAPGQWYVALHGKNGYIIGKMTMQKFSARHILVDGDGKPLLFPTIESAIGFLRTELNVTRPHVFTF